MDEFEIPVLYRDQEMNFPARLLTFTYSYKIEVDIKGTRVHFEPDEEKNWRALIPYEEAGAGRQVSSDLLLAISASIEEILK